MTSEPLRSSRAWSPFGSARVSLMAMEVGGAGVLPSTEKPELFSLGLFADVGEVTRLALATLIPPAGRFAWEGWRVRCKGSARLVGQHHA